MTWNLRLITITGIAIVLVAAGAIAFISTQDDPEDTTAAVEDGTINIPELSETAQLGEALFNENCVGCHGDNSTGTGNGPPLVHVIYEPSHHADISFVLAARNGVRAHHWQFGNMPAQPQVDEEEVLTIVQYVRELQRANGIF